MRIAILPQALASGRKRFQKISDTVRRPGAEATGGTIRPAARRDGAVVAAMAAELSAGAGKPPRDFSEADFRRDGFGHKAAFSCLIAEIEDGAVGFAMFHPAYDTESGERGAFLHDLYVRPAWRRRGLGRDLLAGVCQATKAAGGCFVWWCMVRDDKPAERFYRHLAAPLDDLKIWIAAGEIFDRLIAGSGGS